MNVRAIRSANRHGGQEKDGEGFQEKRKERERGNAND